MTRISAASALAICGCLYASSTEAFTLHKPLQKVQQQQSTSLLESKAEEHHSSVSRRKALDITAALATGTILATTTPALADDDQYVQQGNGFSFRFVPPAEFEPGAKPVKTHLFEINWKSPTVSRYQFGVTVDPVRIQNLKEFGTPEEVAAKVVTAEVNRDGIFEVTLVKDPVAVEEDGVLSYVLNYLSVGKRGDKRFVAKFCIQNQRLYALTAQILESDYKDREEEIMKAVNAFRVLPL